MKLWHILFVLLNLILCNVVYAESFTIENYDIALQVTENRAVRVSEKIDVYFTQPMHGIIRSIPLRNSDVYNLSVNAPFSSSTAGGKLNIKIGRADELVTGHVSYHIEYTHLLHDKKTEFYYNLIGTEWGVTIANAHFYVKMPKPIAAEKTGLSVGRYGTRGFDGDAEYMVQNQEIVGQTRRMLSPNEGITLRIEVPADYFQNIPDKWEKRVWIGLFVFTFLAFMIWYLFGKDEHVTPVVTFQAPQEIVPTEAELIMTETVSDKGLIGLLIKLANDGYFKIESNKKRFTLSDFKPYQGQNKTEAELLRLLEEETHDGKVSDKELKNSIIFYEEWTSLIKEAADKHNKRHFYEKSSMNWLLKIILILLIFGIFMLTIFAFMDYRVSDIASSCGMLIMMPIFFAGILQGNASLKQKIYAFIFMMLFFAFPIMQFWENTKPQHFSQAVFGTICFLIAGICYYEMLKPNFKGRILKGKLLGLKKFIKVAEKERLEKMVEENPQYFYKILPYAYLLGVSDVWVKQFEGIAVPPPLWAIDSVYNIQNFEGFTDVFQKAVAPSIENGGISQTSSSGFGGFSGGGFGGGGGSSW